MSGSSPTVTVTNESSRTFKLGEKMLLPHVPVDLTEEEAGVLEQNHWSEFFTSAPYTPIPPEDPPSRSAR